MNPSSSLIGPGSITDVAGIEVGHFTDTRRPTGCTVVLARGGAVAGVDVRGAAPGTRETDLLDPCNVVSTVHAILLAGGSAWGLDAATGVMRWLESQGIGLEVGRTGVELSLQDRHGGIRGCFWGLWRIDIAPTRRGPYRLQIAPNR